MAGSFKFPVGVVSPIHKSSVIPIFREKLIVTALTSQSVFFIGGFLYEEAIWFHVKPLTVVSCENSEKQKNYCQDFSSLKVKESLLWLTIVNSAPSMPIVVGSDFTFVMCGFMRVGVARDFSYIF